MDIYARIAERIIESQEAIIGPVAIEQASQIPNLTLDWKNHNVSIAGDEEEVVNNLVQVFQELFGQISVEVSKQATASLLSQLPPDGLPEALK